MNSKFKIQNSKFKVQHLDWVSWAGRTGFRGNLETHPLGKLGTLLGQNFELIIDNFELEQSDLTFRYSENGPVGLLNNRKTYLIVTSERNRSPWFGERLG